MTTEPPENTEKHGGIVLKEEVLTGQIIAAAIEVHRVLGPGLLESSYEIALCHELALRGLSFERQRRLPVEYKGKHLGSDYRLDLTVEGKVLVEIKAVEELKPIHDAQLLTYLRHSDFTVGLLINFNVRYLKDGIRRMVL